MKNIILLIAILSFVSCSPKEPFPSFISNKNTVSYSNKKIKINRLGGTWLVVEKYRNQEQIDLSNSCELQEEIEIFFRKKSIVLIKEYGIKAYEVGRSDYRFCSFDPETFEQVIETNICDNAILQSTTDSRIWYEHGEGLLVEYQAYFDGSRLVLQGVKNHLGDNLPLTTWVLNKSRD